MNGAAFDGTLEYLNKVRDLKAIDKKQYCEAIQNLKHYKLRYGLNLYAEKIDEFDRKVTNDIIDNETMIIADQVFNIIYRGYSNSLYKKVQSYEKKVKNQIRGHKMNIRMLKIIYRLLQVIVILGASALPFILNNNDLPKSVPTIVSIVVAASAAISTIFKFKDYISYYQHNAERLQQEYNLYQTDRKHYSNLKYGAALDLLMDKIDELRQEQNELSIALEKTSQEQDQKIESLTAHIHKK